MRYWDLNKNDHRYLTDHNLIINREIYDLFIKNKVETESVAENLFIDNNFFKNKIRNIGSIIFQISQDCNLSCRYCTYSGSYFFQRSATKRNLSIDVAKRALTMLYEQIHGRNKKELFIGFYGGEPLIRYQTIRKIVEYSINTFKDWNILFSITTNGTLLRKEIADFLISNNFLISISVDGPQDIHDAKRTFHNGAGTYKQIINNLIDINNKNIRYFARNVRINSTWSPDLPFNRIYDYFISDRLLSNSSISLGPVNYVDTDYYDKCSLDIESSSQDFGKILDIISDKVQHKNRLFPIESFLYQVSYGLIEKCLGERGVSSTLNSCNFGHRIFIDIDGNYHVCEKINDKFSFGSISEGFDLDKMKKIALDYLSINTSYCHKCEIRFLCQRCYVTFAGDGKFRIEENYCRMKKKSIYQLLERYIKHNESALKISEPVGRKKGRNSQVCSAPISANASVKNANLAPLSNPIQNSPCDRGGRRHLSNLRRVLRFHQFVHIEKGLINSAIIDFLKGNIFQVNNEVLEDYEKGVFNKIGPFMKLCDKEQLFIDVNDTTWIPYIRFSGGLDGSGGSSLSVEIEEGLSIGSIRTALNNLEIGKIKYYGKKRLPVLFRGVRIIRGKMEFGQCREASTIEGRFPRVDETSYMYNMKFNSCWGHKMAITKDGEIRPCIFSKIRVGHINMDDMSAVVNKMRKKYWAITKDRIIKCKDCELRYACFDCREIAFRAHYDLFGPNPHCNYDPYIGVWRE